MPRSVVSHNILGRRYQYVSLGIKCRAPLSQQLVQAYVCVDANLQGLTEEEAHVSGAGPARRVCRNKPLLMSVAAEGTSVEAAYFGELGYELQLYSPFRYYLHLHAILRKTIGPSNSAAYNYFSPNHTELTISRNNCQGTYVHHRVPFDYSSWRPPPYKDHFENNELKFEKPLVIIHNKYAQEWDEPPVNFIGYSEDFSKTLQFNYHKELRQQHPEVLFFHDLMKMFHEHDYNRLQLMLHANCNHFVSVQGGNSVIASYFAGTNVIYAVKGHEIEHVYCPKCHRTYANVCE